MEQRQRLRLRSHSLFDTFITAGVKSWALLYGVMLSNQKKFLRRSLKLFFFLLKRRTPCHSVYMFYAKQQRIRAWALTLTIDQNSQRYNTLPVFLLCCLFFPWKRIIKKTSATARAKEKVSAREKGRGCREIVFIACGRWMMARHKNPTKASRWSLCDSKTPNVRWRFFTSDLWKLSVKTKARVSRMIC